MVPISFLASVFLLLGCAIVQHTEGRLDLSPEKLSSFHYCVGPNCDYQTPPNADYVMPDPADEASGKCEDKALRIDMSDCRHYFQCVNGSHWVREACPPNEAWSPYMGFCVRKEYVKCDTRCQVEGKFGDEYDCKDFWICIHKRPFRFTCAIGTHYDENTGRCDLGVCSGVVRKPHRKVIPFKL